LAVFPTSTDPYSAPRVMSSALSMVAIRKS